MERAVDVSMERLSGDIKIDFVSLLRGDERNVPLELIRHTHTNAVVVSSRPQTLVIPCLLENVLPSLVDRSTFDCAGVFA